MTDRPPSFVHAADLHLGAPLQSLGGRLPGNPQQRLDKLRELRELASQAFDKMIDAVLSSDAAFVVLSGDIYDQAEREVASQLRFVRGLRRLRDDGSAPVPVFVVHGNHDPLASSFSLAAEMPDNVTVFGSGDPAIEVVEVDGFGPVSVAGVSFASTSETENLVRKFAQLPADSAHPLVGVVHANVEGVPGHDPYAPCSVDDLRQSPVDYWALGHVHSRQIEQLGPGRWWAYPGNLQGRSNKAAECGPKGVLRVPLEAAGIGAPEFVACDTIRFGRHEVDVTGATDIDSVIGAVREAAIAAGSEADGRPVLLAVELAGRTSVHSELMKQDDGLLGLCRESLGGVLGMGELLRVRIATSPEIDREQLLGRGDLLSEILTSIDLIGAGSDTAVAQQVGQLISAADKGVLKLLSNESGPGPDLIGAIGPGGSSLSRELVARAEQLLAESLAAEDDAR